MAYPLRMTRTLWISAMLLWLSAATAHAQDGEEEALAAAQAEGETEAAESAEADESAIRFTGVRVGVAFGGGFFAGSVSGGMGGVGLGLGAQFGPLGVVYKFHQFVGQYTDGIRNEDFYAAWNTLYFDYRFSHFIVGLGPSMDFVWNCRAPACEGGGPYFGIEARFAVRISRFHVGLGTHPTFFPNGAINMLFLFFGF